MRKLSIGALAVALVFASALAWQGMVPTKVEASALSVTGGHEPPGCDQTTAAYCTGSGEGCTEMQYTSCPESLGLPGTCKNVSYGCIGIGCDTVWNEYCDES